MNIAETSGAGRAAATPLIRRGVAGCGAAVALAGAVYLNALDNPFIYDDYRLVALNQSLRDLSNLRAVFWHEVTRPLVNLSYAIDRAIWGPGVFGFHLTSVLLHMINVALVGALAWKTATDWRPTQAASGRIRPDVAALVASLLFAAHPMMTEAVGYISGRSEVLCATFFLLALLSARTWIRGAGRRWLVLAVGCWLLALASKEVAAMFPFATLAYDRLVSPGSPPERRRRLWWLHIPLFTMAVLLIAIRLAVFQFVEHGGGVRVQWSLGLVELDVVRQYLGLMIRPMGQAIFHGVSSIDSIYNLRAIAGLAIVGAVLALAWRLRRAGGGVSFGVVWFLLLLVPSSAVVMLDRGEPMAEHRVYLASCGLFLAAGLAAGRLWEWVPADRRILRGVLAISLVAIVVSLAGRTVLRNAVWDSGVMVWAEAAAQAPDQWLPNLGLGEELHKMGAHAEAAKSYRLAIAARPQDPAAYSKLGVCLSELGDLAGAQKAFEQLRALDWRSAEASNGLATVALLSGHFEDAKRGYLATLALDPPNVAARHGLAVIEERDGGNPAEALRLCEEIRTLAPDTPGNDECISRNKARLAGKRDGGR